MNLCYGRLLKIILGDKVITSVFNLNLFAFWNSVIAIAKFTLNVRIFVIFFFSSFFSYSILSLLMVCCCFCHFVRSPVDSILMMGIACRPLFHQLKSTAMVLVRRREVNRNDFNLVELHADAFENHKLHMRQPCQSQSILFMCKCKIY